LWEVQLRYAVANPIRNDWSNNARLTAGFVIAPSFIGTLKSTRIRTRLSLRSRSVIDNLFDRDIVVVQAKDVDRA
jgi:hypothetical protein